MRSVALKALFCLIVSSSVLAQDRSTPEAAVNAFLSAFTTGDVKLAAQCVKGSSVSPAMIETLSKEIKKDPASFTLGEAKSEITGTTATVRGTVTIQPQKEKKSQSFSTELKLEQVAGNWLIVPDGAKVKRDGGQDMANALAWALTDTTVFRQANEAARETVCLSNMKQVCLAAMMFVQDSDEKLKLAPDTYKKNLMPYTKNEGIFHCPSDSGRGGSYAFNGHLAGVSLARIRRPAETVMFYEGKSGKLDFRHGGRAAIGFADGHAKLINAEGAKKLRWTP